MHQPPPNLQGRKGETRIINEIGDGFKVMEAPLVLGTNLKGLTARCSPPLSPALEKQDVNKAANLCVIFFAIPLFDAHSQAGP